MITTTQLKILEAVKRGKKTVKDIKEDLGIVSQSLVPQYLKVLESKKLIEKTKIANIHIYQIQYSNPLVFNYLELHTWDILSQEVRIFLIKITQVIHVPILIYGSYAKKTNTRNSDLDIAIISSNKKNIETKLEDILLSTPLKIDIHIISPKELKTMIVAAYENLGKEIVRNNLPVSNSREFYHITLDKFGDRP